MDERKGGPLPYYCGGRQPNCDYHDGQLPPVRGAGCFQVTRANRSHPELDDGTGCTYKHGADLAYWNSRFYVHYFVNPVSEHTGAGQSVLASSEDGRVWDSFCVAFPAYRIPACKITDYKGNAAEFNGQSFAFIHQWVGFYRTKNNRLLLLGFYGWSPQPWVNNWDNYGIGRVVRELYSDGTMGPIYFVRPCWQGGWSREQLLYPLYTESPDAGFVECCQELLGDSLAVQQWAEENGDKDQIIRIKHDPQGPANQAFCWYHIGEESVIGLWKHSRCARSDDGGATWSPVRVSPSLVMSGQKVWAQSTPDGRYAMFYDPTLESTHRWPLCVTLSDDGIAFRDMMLVHGEVPPMRFGGFWKDFGPQYMRGIAEGMERPQDAVWLAYTVNKEDVWVARLPLPITGRETQRVLTGGFEDFTVYSPKWASVEITDRPSLQLRDCDPYDYAKAERVLYEASRQQVNFEILPHQNAKGELYCELKSPEGHTAVRLVFRGDGRLWVRTTALVPFCPYHGGTKIGIRLEADCESNGYVLSVDGGEKRRLPFMTAVKSISRFVLRTGAPRLGPTREEDPKEDPAYGLPDADEREEEAVYELTDFQATSGEA